MVGLPSSTGTVRFEISFLVPPENAPTCIIRATGKVAEKREWQKKEW